MTTVTSLSDSSTSTAALNFHFSRVKIIPLCKMFSRQRVHPFIVPVAAVEMPWMDERSLFLIRDNKINRNLVIDDKILYKLGIDHAFFGQPRYLTTDEIASFIPLNEEIASMYSRAIGYQRHTMRSFRNEP